jgi:predicted small secreted protein
MFIGGKPMKNRVIAALLVGALVLPTAACNTVKGLGRDIQSVGEAGDRAIDKTASDQTVYPG